MIGVSKAIDDANCDLYSLGECKKMLVSPQFLIAFRGMLIKRAVDCGFHYLPSGEQMFFKGVPVVECDFLEDLEYAFVK